MEVDIYMIVAGGILAGITLRVLVTRILTGKWSGKLDLGNRE